MENKMDCYCFACGTKLPDRSPKGHNFKCGSCGTAFSVYAVSWDLFPRNETTDDSQKPHEDTGTPMIEGRDGIKRPAMGNSPLIANSEIRKLQETVANIVVNGNLMLSHLKSMLQVHDPQLIDTLPKSMTDTKFKLRV